MKAKCCVCDKVKLIIKTKVWGPRKKDKDYYCRECDYHIRLANDENAEEPDGYEPPWLDD